MSKLLLWVSPVLVIYIIILEIKLYRMSIKKDYNKSKYLKWYIRYIDERLKKNGKTVSRLEKLKQKHERELRQIENQIKELENEMEN